MFSGYNSIFRDSYFSIVLDNVNQATSMIKYYLFAGLLSKYYLPRQTMVNS